jgi:hypothetical protein
VIISPQEGKQSEFVHSEADIAFFGGSAGSGKTYSLAMIPLMFIDEPTFNAVIMRKTYPEIFNPGGLWEEMEALYSPCGAVANMSSHTWTFPSGMYVQAAHMQHEKDKHKYQGSQIVYIAFDELVHFSKTQFFYMVSRNRKVGSPTKPFLRATMNADADSWVADFIAWWIDEDGFVIPERSGVMRWFIVKNDKEIWADSPEPLKKIAPDQEPVSFTYISASIDDNQMFMQRGGREYISKLKTLDEVQQQRLLHANWKIRDFGRRLFKLPSFVPWPEVDSIGYVDPAYSGGNHSSFTIAAKNGDRYCLRGYTWDKHIGDCYQEILALCKRYRVGTLAVEANADKGSSARDLNKMRGGNVIPVNEKMNKHVRIVQYVRNNWPLIDFADDTEKDYMDCLLNYAEGLEPDDEADSAAGAIRMLTQQRARGFRFHYADI